MLSNKALKEKIDELKRELELNYLRCQNRKTEKNIHKMHNTNLRSY